jgi:very-short-patch-repair endonuclease
MLTKPTIPSSTLFQAQDAARTAKLARRGYRVIRFWNNEVMLNLAGVLDIVRRELDG